MHRLPPSLCAEQLVVACWVPSQALDRHGLCSLQVTVSGTVPATVWASSDLAMSGTASCSGECGWISDSEDGSVTGTAKGVSADAKVYVKAVLNFAETTVTVADASVSELVLAYESVDFDVEDLGIFDALASAILTAVSGLFEDTITGALADVAENAIDVELSGQLPISASFA